MTTVHRHWCSCRRERSCADAARWKWGSPQWFMKKAHLTPLWQQSWCDLTASRVSFHDPVFLKPAGVFQTNPILHPESEAEAHKQYEISNRRTSWMSNWEWLRGRAHSEEHLGMSASSYSAAHLQANQKGCQWHLHRLAANPTWMERTNTHSEGEQD